MWVSSFGNGMKVGLLSGTIGISQNGFEKQIINSYPNPFGDILYLSNQSNIPISKIKIYNGEGQLLISKQDQCNFINTEQLSPGVYILEIITEGKSRVFEKIIK